MIQLITREEAFEGNKAFESHIFRIQNTLYNPMDPENRTVVGEEQWDAFQNKFRVFHSVEECEAHNAKLNERFLEKKDEIQDHGLEITHSFGYVVNHTSKNLRETDWGTWLTELVEALGETTITFLLDYDIEWQARGRDRDREVNKRLKYFKKIGVGAYFGGGIQATGEDITHLFNAVFNLTQVEGLYPTPWFKFGKAALIGTVTEESSIEFLAFDEDSAEKLMAFAADRNVVEQE